MEKRRAYFFSFTFCIFPEKLGQAWKNLRYFYTLLLVREKNIMQSVLFVSSLKVGAVFSTGLDYSSL